MLTIFNLVLANKKTHLYFSKTEYRKLTVSLHYPPNYPNQTLHVELKSKYLSYDILQQISKVCMEELKSQVGHQQVSTCFVLFIITRLNKFSCIKNIQLG